MVNIIYFITGNETKVLHAQTALNKYDITVIQKKLEIIEPREEEPEKVAAEKVLQAYEKTHEAVMAEDSGIFIEALNGFPKTFVHFTTDTIGITGILKLLEGKTNRKAEFRQALAYMEPAMKNPKVFSYIDGGFKVAETIQELPGELNIFSFDQILIPPGEEKALCLFDKKWRAERDFKQNGDNMHFVQLAIWIKNGGL